MNKSESIAKLADALAKAQATIGAAVKNQVNPAFKNTQDEHKKHGTKYADLGAVFLACKAALTGNGIAVSQVPSFRENGPVTLVTLLMHASGEWLSGEYPIIPVKADPQGMGSAMTYARRYSLASMIGIAADEDDDGNAASAGNGKAAASNGNGHAAYVTEKQALDLETLADEVKANKPAFLEWLKAGSFATIPAAQHAMALAALKKKQAAS